MLNDNGGNISQRARRRSLGVVDLVVATVLTGPGCLIEEKNYDYCSNVNGDSFCAQRHGNERRFCLLGSDACWKDLSPELRGDPNFDGCMEVEPDDPCHSPCGGGQPQGEIDMCRIGGEGTDPGRVTSEMSADGTSSEENTSTGPASVCGDGVREGGEQCDGTDLAGQDCETRGFDDGSLACGQDCTFDTRGCQSWSCGNSNREDEELCDGDDLAGQTCETLGYSAGILACEDDCLAFDTSGCSICGNGIQEADEACDGSDFANDAIECMGHDPNFTGGSLGCDGACLVVTDDCYHCGNAAIEGGEICDGTALPEGETCESQGYEPGKLACASDCLGFDIEGCGAGDCCAVHEEAGCGINSCEQEICDGLPGCCNFAWSLLCVGAAIFVDNCGCT